LCYPAAEASGHEKEVGLRLDEDTVRGTRERLGLTLAMVAQRAGTSKNTVMSAEHGADIRPTTARKIAEALGVEIVDLLGASDSPKAVASPSQPEERRSEASPTAGEIKAISRWLSYLEQRLGEGNLTRDEIAHDIDAARAFGIGKDPTLYPTDLVGDFLQIGRRALEEGKSFDALQTELAGLEADMDRLEEVHAEAKESQT
jgi:transcriptional regulator with XRE-family HTH domain